MSEPVIIKAKGDHVNIALAVWEGKGEPVLCVHGIAASCRSWDIVANALAPDHLVLSMDLRGRGLSDKPPSGYSIMNHCRDISALLKDRGIERAVIIGHSLGAHIGLAFVARYPKRVNRLILVDGGGKLTEEQTNKVFAGIQPTLDRLGRVFPSEKAYLAPLGLAVTRVGDELSGTPSDTRDHVDPELLAEAGQTIAHYLMVLSAR